MEPNPERSAPLFRDVIVHGRDPSLDGEGTFERVNRAGELGEDAVPRRVGNAPAILMDEAPSTPDGS